ncbi:hypothetical protein [Nocardia stercoris]|uniref:Uncharacterized protein n=1 Tax=Nocardia stercoris TaxID=2483361 RepID=A0A3M2KYK6_9NOCA|nr:hypothetical protein [Nocardia stercoris]RMI29530.1 hypothetical protein EBN03_26025 [Nocardia stercoris]
MADALDIDAPDEVISASGRVHAAAGDARDHVHGALAAMTGGGAGGSLLDQELVDKLRWITSSFGRAVTAHAERSEALHDYTTQAAQDLRQTDIDGGGPTETV